MKSKSIICVLSIVASLTASCSNNSGLSGNRSLSDSLSKFTQSAIRFIGKTACSEEDKKLANQLEDKLSECEALNSSQIQGDKISYSVYNSCIESASKVIHAMKAFDCKKVYLKYWIDVDRSLVSRAAEKIRKGEENSPLTENDLINFFKLMDSWMSSLKRELLSDDHASELSKSIQTIYNLSPHQWVAQESERVLRAFWNRLLLLTREDPTLLQQEQTFAQSLLIHTQLIRTATLQSYGFDHKSTLDPQLLYPLFSQILMPMSERAEVLAELHDLQCSLKGCPTEQKELSFHPSQQDQRDFESLLSILGLANTLDSHLQNDLIKTGISKAEAISNKEVGTFARAYLEALPILNQAHLHPGENWAALSQIPSGILPDYMQEFASVVSNFSEMSRNFEKTGLYFQSKPSDLDFGLTAENIGVIKDQVHSHVNGLYKAIEEYKNSLLTAASDAKEKINLEGRKSRIKEMLLREIENLRFLRTDLTGAQITLRNDDDRFARYFQDTIRFFDSANWKDNESHRFISYLQRTFSISPEDSKYQAKTSEFFTHPELTLHEMVVSPERSGQFHAEPGDIFAFQINGHWSPTCALQKSNYPVENKIEALVGPEGFMLEEESSKIRIEAINKSKSAKNFKNNSVTESTNLNAGFNVSLNFGILNLEVPSFNHGWNRSQNKGQDLSWGSEQSAVQESENRQDATFHSGLRLPNTPFPDMPAGSLLLVQVKQGGTHYSDIVDVRVLNSLDTVVAREPVDLYFIVNDLNDPSCKGHRTEALTIQLEQRRPHSQLAKNFTSNLIQAAHTISQEGAAYVRSGSITLNQLSQLRLNAIKEAVIEGDEPDSHPLLKQLFEAWMSRELDQLETHIRIMNLERQIKLIKHRIAALRMDFEFLEKEQDLASLSQVWAFDNHDLGFVGRDLRRAGEFIRHRLLPVIKIRFPQVLKQLTNSESQGLSVDTSFGKVAEEFHSLLSQLDYLLSGADIQENVVDSIRPLVISFPKEQREFVSSFPKVPFLASLGVWNGLFNSLQKPGVLLKDGSGRRQVTPVEYENYSARSRAVFKVSPEDLYVANTTYSNGIMTEGVLSGSLPCHAAAPIVDSMGIYFLLNPQSDETRVKALNEALHEIDIKLKSNPQFPTEEGIQEFSLTRNWTKFRVPVYYGDSPTPRFDFVKQSISQEKMGKGISPFGEFEINFKDFNFSGPGILEGLDQDLKEIMLVFKVKYRSAPKDLEWLPRCKKDDQFN